MSGYVDLRISAMQWDAYQRGRIRLSNMAKAFDRMGVPVPPDILLWIDGLEKGERACIRAVRAACIDDATYGPIAGWVEEMPGLGPSVLCVLGLIRPITEFANPAKLWKYLGLHVNSAGAADRHPDPNNGVRFSPQLRAYATVRIMDPIIKHRESPYNPLYYARRAHTDVTHPEWSVENPKAPDMHSHRDAIRYVAKRVWRDVWRVGHRSMGLMLPSGELAGA